MLFFVEGGWKLTKCGEGPCTDSQTEGERRSSLKMQERGMERGELGELDQQQKEGGSRYATAQAVPQTRQTAQRFARRAVTPSRARLGGGGGHAAGDGEQAGVRYPTAFLRAPLMDAGC